MFSLIDAPAAPLGAANNSVRGCGQLKCGVFEGGVYFRHYRDYRALHAGASARTESELPAKVKPRSEVSEAL